VPSSPEPRSILFINVSRIGDTLLATPALRALARAWPGARLLAVTGLGHGRILRDDDVIQAAADFIAGRSQVASPALPELPQPAPAW